MQLPRNLLAGPPVAAPWCPSPYSRQPRARLQSQSQSQNSPSGGQQGPADQLRNDVAAAVHGERVEPGRRQPGLSRRTVLCLPPATAAAIVAASAAPAPLLGSAHAAEESLFERITSASPPRAPTRNPLARGPQQLEYPRWMFGEWRATSRLVAASAPLGTRLLPRSAPPLGDPATEPPLQYDLRFYSTLPNTVQNQLRVALGQLPQDAVVAARAFNTRSSANAAAGWDAVEAVEYDPSSRPDRVTLTFSRLSPDMRPLPPRRVELFLSSLRSEARLLEPEEGGSAAPLEEFAAAEMCRQVVVGGREVEVADYEVMNLFRQQPGGAQVGVRQRVCVYLTPQDEGYFQAGGRAVLVFDYDVDLERLSTADGVVCVETPKAVVQCV